MLFAPKRPNLAQNWHFWLIWARPCRLIECPVGGSVGGCGARAVSRKTPIYFMEYNSFDDDNECSLNIFCANDDLNFYSGGRGQSCQGSRLWVDQGRLHR